MTDNLLPRVEAHEYRELFLQDLHWSAPDHPPITFTSDEGDRFTATNVSSYKGLRVWVCDSLPGAATEAALDRLIAKTSTDRLVIFHSASEQVWRWPVRRNKDNSVTSRLTSHRHRTGTANPRLTERLDAIRLPLDATLDANSVLAKVRSAFDVETKNETRYASKLMARMYAAVERGYGKAHDPAKRDHEISVTLARILFLMFGDDTEMWATDSFRKLVAHSTAPDGSDLGATLNSLFAHLDDRMASTSELAAFPYVNGGIFGEAVTLPPLNAEFRDTLLEACDVDWSTISPAIFGSMFQSVRDAKTRRELGEHYTSEENILKTLNPLFLDELRHEFDRAQTMKDEKKVLNRLWGRLGELRYMDPACGCGNFIIVAYRELRDLELQVMERLQAISGNNQLSFDPTLSLKVTLDHFYGIEIDEWPARIAETAMFLIDRQCDLRLKERFGEAPQRLPIQTQATIVSGVSALALDWSTVVTPSEHVVVAGNPPFLGISLRSATQTAELQAVWGGRYHGTLDYVTGWHAKAVDYFAGVDGRWAFVTTNSITQGEVVAPLFSQILDQGWHIKFAHRTFGWTSEAAGQAAVHCVIIGFARKVSHPRLFDYSSTFSGAVEVPKVKNITPYLTDGPNVLVWPSNRPINAELGEVAYGNKPTDGGWLVVDVEEATAFRSDPIARKYLRRYIGARELIHGLERYCLWLRDAPPSDLRSSKLIHSRVEGVRTFREESKAPSTRAASATAHLFRQIAQPKEPYLCIPRHVSETRPYFLAARFGADVITSDANFLAPDADGFMFAVISSAMFITWQRTIGGRIKSDLRFNKLLTWNTFPLPPTDPTKRRQLIEAGGAVLAARDLSPDLSLADLYTLPLSEDLKKGHAELDERMDRLFGIRDTPTEADRQDVLFAAYQSLTSPLLASSDSSTRRRRK